MSNTTIEVRVKLHSTGDTSPAEMRRRFVEGLNDFADQGVMFTCDAEDEEIHIVKATAIRRQSKDS